MSKLKAVLSNLFSFGVIDFLGLIMPIIVMPILTRTLGENGYGNYLLVLTILYFGHTIIDYGTQYTAVRKVANHQGDIDKQKLIYGQTQGLRVVLAAFLYCRCADLWIYFLR
ncbi:oligosaccharide flippase family protein [Vibrio variabilis]|uniref:oligosaccharide flippase family protein n=1 Tax=Vibrio variabilis TaxID=990271 RepID=UPI0013A6D7EA